MTTPAINGQPDAKELARLLILQKAILDVLKDVDAETREQARTIFESGDAASARNNGQELGRVRRDRPRQEWKVVDWTAWEAWARENVPSACSAVEGWLLTRVKRDGGVYIRPATGEVLEPAGIALQEQSEGNLVVTTTEVAVEWARQMVGRSIAGELE